MATIKQTDFWWARGPIAQHIDLCGNRAESLKPMKRIGCDATLPTPHCFSNPWQS